MLQIRRGQLVEALITGLTPEICANSRFKIAPTHGSTDSGGSGGGGGSISDSRFKTYFCEEAPLGSPGQIRSIPNQLWFADPVSGPVER